MLEEEGLLEEGAVDALEFAGTAPPELDAALVNDEEEELALAARVEPEEKAVLVAKRG